MRAFWPWCGRTSLLLNRNWIKCYLLYQEIISLRLFFISESDCCRSSDEVMLRAQALGRVALGCSGLHMNRSFKPTNLRPTAFFLGARFSPSRVDLWRSCSILGSPACGGHTNPSQSLFQDVLEAFPNNRCRIITKFGLDWDLWSLQVFSLCLWLWRFPAARAANERQHDRFHILRGGVSLLGEFKLWWLLLRNLVEQDSEKWHEENLARHPSHYASFARSLP